MQNRNHHRKQAIEFYDLAAVEFENKAYEKALAFEAKAKSALKEAHAADHAQVDTYINALYFCRTAYICYILGLKENAYVRFQAAFKYFSDVCSEKPAREVYIYFAQANYGLALMHSVDKDYKKSIAAGKHAIEIIKKIPSGKQISEDHVYLFSYYNAVANFEIAIHPEKALKIAKKVGDKALHLFGSLTKFSYNNEILYMDEANKAGAMLRNIPGIFVEDQATLLQAHSVFKLPPERKSDAAAKSAVNMTMEVTQVVKL